MATVPRRERIPRPAGAIPEVESLATSWFTNYREKKRIEAAQEGTKSEPGLRIRLLDQVKNLGKPDSDGHRWYWFKQSLGGLYGLKAQRSVSVGWDEVAALAILRQKPKEVLDACITTTYAFDGNKMPLIVETLRKAGVLDECLAEGYPAQHIDSELVLGYHQKHKDVITDKEVDQMMPDSIRWSLIPLDKPGGGNHDAD